MVSIRKNCWHFKNNKIIKNFVDYCCSKKIYKWQRCKNTIKTLACHNWETKCLLEIKFCTESYFYKFYETHFRKKLEPRQSPFNRNRNSQYCQFLFCLRKIYFRFQVLLFLVFFFISIRKLKNKIQPKICVLILQ